MDIKTVAPELPKFSDVSKEIKACFNRKYVTNDGPNLIKFEKNLKKYFKSNLKPIVFCNGESALYSLIQVWKFLFKIKKCKALVPSFTFSGTVNALVQNNITPIFCDVDETLTINTKKIKIDKDTKFLIGVSVYGNIPNIFELKEFAKKNGLIFILDNAPGFGSRIKSKFPSNYGVEEIYSFHATKVFNSIEGGCVVTSNKKIHKLLLASRNFGQSNKKSNDIILPGLNSKMNELSAIIGLENLKNFKTILNKRKKIIAEYCKFFKILEQNGHVTLMKVNNNVFCNYFFFPLILKKINPSKFINYMEKKKIYCRRYYKSVHTLSYYKKKFLCSDYNNCKCTKTCKKKTGLKKTELIKNKIVSIPLNSNMTKSQVNYLFKNINNFFNIAKI